VRSIEEMVEAKQAQKQSRKAGSRSMKSKALEKSGRLGLSSARVSRQEHDESGARHPPVVPSLAANCAIVHAASSPVVAAAFLAQVALPATDMIDKKRAPADPCHLELPLLD
jgi:hypothetical protein